jgi:hypothetical protein
VIGRRAEQAFLSALLPGHEVVTRVGRREYGKVISAHWMQAHSHSGAIVLEVEWRP